MDLFSQPMFIDEMFRRYFKMCNVAPIWKQLTEFGSYNQNTDEGSGLYANVSYKTILVSHLICLFC